MPCGAHSRLAKFSVGLALAIWLTGPAWAGGAPPPDQAGPWQVGRSSVTLVDSARDGRSLTVDLWYPIDAPGNAVASVYDLVFAALPSPTAFGDVAVSTAGPFPLIVFSHGSGGIRFQSYFLTEALASHGFIVVAPDHTGNTAADLVFGTTLPIKTMTLERRLDVSFVIDEILALNALPGSLLDGRIDAARVGLTGHSFGGFTSLAGAGSFAGIAADARIDAIAPFAPATGFLLDADLAAVDVPVLVLGGQKDTTTPLTESDRVFELAEGRPIYQLDLADAGHQSFTNLCDFAAVLLDAGIPANLIDFLLGNLDQGCADTLIAPAEAHRATKFLIVAFMQTHVAGRGGEYAHYLDHPALFEFAVPAKLYRK